MINLSVEQEYKLLDTLDLVLEDRGISAPEDLIMVGLNGSITHGLARAVSDLDVVGITYLPPSYTLGLQSTGTLHKAHVDGHDFTIYSVHDYIALALKGNPTILESLWLKWPFYVKVTEAFRAIRESREIFMSKKCYGAFIAYAKHQLDKMNRPHGQMGAERKELFYEHGYDPKHASHVFRLLFMGIQVLETHEMDVYRSEPERAFLLDVKAGRFKLEDVRQMAELYLAKAEDVFEETTLPDEPDYDAANKLLIRLEYENLQRQMR